MPSGRRRRRALLARVRRRGDVGGDRATRIGPGGLEIGHWLDHQRLGRGIASRAARLLTGAALTAPGVTHTEIHHDERNLASAGVPRRLGYERVAIEPDAAPPPPAVAGVSWVWRMTPERWPGAVPAQTV